MSRIASLVCLLSVSLLAQPLCGEEPFTKPGEIKNAALVYWQSFAVMPELSEAEAKLLHDIEQGEKPAAEAEDLLKNSHSSFHLIQSITPATPCRWEIIVNGPSTLLPHLNQARLLARLLLLEARLKAEKNPAAAIAPLTSALLIARNVDDGVLIQFLVGEAIEAQTLDVTEPLLDKMDAKTAAALKESFSQLPPRASLDKAILSEREVFGQWLEPLFVGEPAVALQRLRELGAGNDLGEIVRLTAMLALPKEERQAAFNQFLSQYDKMAAACRLPAEKSAEAMKNIEQGIKDSNNSLIQMLMPALSKADERHRQTEKRYQLFQESLDKAAGE